MLPTDLIYYPGEFDYLRGPLTCIRCNNTTEDTVKANVQTKAHINPTGSVIGIGDRIEGFSEPYFATGYFHFSIMYDPAKFTFLESWDCPYCLESGWIFCRTQDNNLKEVTISTISPALLRKSDLVTILITNIFPIGFLKTQGMILEKASRANKEQLHAFFRDYLHSTGRES